MDDLTKELWQGVAERASKPEPVYPATSAPHRAASARGR